MQFVWNKIGPTFLSACPKSLHKALRFNWLSTRVSINLINGGLATHLDNVIPNQPDDTKSVPDISISVHLGAAESDSVYLGFNHEPHMHEIKPGTLVLFPGYLLPHRTRRPIVTQPAQKRYSLVVFLQFKKECVEQADKYIRESFDALQVFKKKD